MKKFLSAITIMLFSLFSLTSINGVASPISVLAAQEGYSLEVYLERAAKEGVSVDLELYQVALGTSYDYEINEEFEAVSEDIEECDFFSASQMSELTKEIASYVENSGLKPFETGKTDEEGVYAFMDLEEGLYFIPSVSFENENDEEIRSESILLWLYEDTSAEPKDYVTSLKPDTPDEPADKNPVIPDNPSDGIVGIDPSDPAGGNSIGGGSKDPSSSIGIDAKDPASSANSVNTAVQNDQTTYVMIFVGALLVFVSAFLLLRKKEQ